MERRENGNLILKPRRFLNKTDLSHFHNFKPWRAALYTFCSEEILRNLLSDHVEATSWFETLCRTRSRLGILDKFDILLSIPICLIKIIRITRIWEWYWGTPLSWLAIGTMMPGTSLIDKAQKDKFDKLEMDKGHEFNDQRPFRLSSLFDHFQETFTIDSHESCFETPRYGRLTIGKEDWCLTIENKVCKHWRWLLRRIFCW